MRRLFLLIIASTLISPSAFAEPSDETAAAVTLREDGLADAELGAYDKAAGELAEAVKIHPNDAHAWSG